MSKILVLYYSRSGNTEKMLNYHVEADELAGFDAIFVGAPTYHHDTPIDMKKLFEEAAEKGISLKGKVGAAFGSYGWSGEAPKLLLEIMKNRFEMRVTEPPLLAKYVPKEKMLGMCRDFGKRVSETLMHQA
jgi:flavorubredoxin